MVWRGAKAEAAEWGAGGAEGGEQGGRGVILRTVVIIFLFGFFLVMQSIFIEYCLFG